MSDRRTDVCVVGAGLAGLSCARLLVRAGIDTLVVEASDGVGGRAATSSTGSCSTVTGPGRRRTSP